MNPTGTTPPDRRDGAHPGPAGLPHRPDPDAEHPLQPNTQTPGRQAYPGQTPQGHLEEAVPIMNLGISRSSGGPTPTGPNGTQPIHSCACGAMYSGGNHICRQTTQETDREAGS